MSKKNVDSNVPNGLAMDGRVIYDYQIGALEGKLLTFIETFGFSELREKAVKDVFKSILRTELYLETQYVSGDYLNEAISKYRASGSGQTSGVGFKS